MENLKPITCCWAFTILYLNFITSNGAEGFHRIRAAGASWVDQKHRTGYHFQPPKNWINDPNGPMYYKGFYHLFYQYNPNGPVWGNIAWGHSYSTDLINWTPLEPAITPSEPFDINGAFSGSATILPGNKPVILYTGVDTNNRQVQNFAYPKNLSDPLLREWIKPDYNPVIVPTSLMDASSFRDPTTAWLGKDGLWRVAVGHKINDTGVALLYRSRDFKTWTKASKPLHSVANTGMWECPDFFPVLLKGENGLDTSTNRNFVKHVLKVSLWANAEIYSVGKYSTDEDLYIPDENSVDNYTGLRLDYGKFYASKSFYDAKNKRRVLWGWVNEADSEMEAIRKGWAGIQAIPRTMWLDSKGEQLVQWPVKELETLREKQSVHLNNESLVYGSILEVQGITAAQADVEVTFGLPSLEYARPFNHTWVDAGILCGQKNASMQGGLGPFGLLTMASKNLEEYTVVFFHVFKTQNKPVVLMCSGGSRSSLGTDLSKPLYGGFVNVDVTDGHLSLRSLIDNSVVESFAAGGRTCITSRVYPTLANGPNAHLFLFNNGTVPVTVNKLVGWSMRKPLMN